MSSSNNSFPEHLQLEGARLVAVSTIDGRVRASLSGADIHYDSYLDAYEAVLLLTGTCIETPTGLPSEIVDVALRAPGTGSWHVFVQLPFSIPGPCRVELSLRSGERLIAEGTSLQIELGQSTRHAYSFEPPEGT